jgi:ribosomal protein L37AE/L43A
MESEDHKKHGDKPCPNCECPNNYDIFNGCYWCNQCGAIFEIKGVKE